MVKMITIIDEARRGTKGFPLHAEALGVAPLTKTVPVDETGVPITEHPGLSLSEMIDIERDSRIDSGFFFNDKFYQSRPEDRENITGATTAALAAIVAGAEVGDFRWANPDKDFEWIAADNTTQPFDAHEMFAFGQKAMQHKSDHIFAARALKDSDPIPQDFTDDKYWP